MSSHIGDAPEGVNRGDEMTLDTRVIAEFGRGLGGAVPEFVAALIEEFIQEAAVQVERMRDAGQRLDAPAMKASAHGLRGSSLMLGVRRLARLCEQLEREAGQPGSYARPEALLSDLDEEFVKVRHALKAELQGAGDR
jgi:HPt (histidine-containing phosphotransfer) domain-containing protein